MPAIFLSKGGDTANLTKSDFFQIIKPLASPRERRIVQPKGQSQNNNKQNKSWKKVDSIDLYFPDRL